MLSELFTSVADALISYAIDNLDPAERIKSWLKQDPAKIAFQKALARAYSAFARQYPEYTSSLFDQSFLSKEALPELSKLLTRSQHPDPALLAQAWGQSIGKDTDFAQAAIKPASYFIKRLEAELKAEPALQALFDSRALESLPKLEAEIQKLASDLKRGLDEALKAANNYQQANIHVGGSVSGDGIVIGHNNQLTINKYDYSTNYYYSGDFVSLNENYIPPDGVFQRVRVDEFVGRDWLTAKVDAFLNDPSQKSGAFLLVGDAGVGKTAFMAHLVKERRYLHLFAEQVPGQAMLPRALQSLGSQLVTRYQINPYKDRDALNVLAGFPDFLERLLRLAASTLTEGEKIVIVCDALDEAGVFPDHFVFGLPKELPDGVYLILSQRPVYTKLPNFEPLRFDLEAQGEDNLQDMEDYLSAVAKRPAVAGQIRAKDYSEAFFIQTLKEKSLGVWMYLHYIVKEIEDGARAPLDLANLPKGLVGYYADYWDDWRYGRKGRGKGEEGWNELYAPLLTTLAAAQDAITAEQLTVWAGVKVDSDNVDALLHDKWRSFILEKEVEGNVLYAPYHLSFRDFITGKVDISKLPIIEQANLVRDLAKKAIRAHKRIVDAFEAECNGEWENLVEEDYPRLHLTAHLVGAKEYKKLTDLLTEGDEKIKWAEAREKKEETYAGYLNDLTHVRDYAEQEQNYALAIRWMLIENSIHSLASNIPPELMVALTKEGLWSYARCLSIIKQKTDSHDIAESIKLIASGLPLELVSEALFLTREIIDESARTTALAALTPYLNEELRAIAFSITCEIKNESKRAYVFKILAPYLDKLQKDFVFTNALEIKDEYARSHALSALTPHLDEKEKMIATEASLSAARTIKEPSNYVEALAFLSPNLNNELKANALQDALTTARKIKYPMQRAEALMALAPYLTEDLKAVAVTAAAKIGDEHFRAKALISLAPFLNNDLKSMIFSSISAIHDKDIHIWSLIDLLPYLNKNLLLTASRAALSLALESPNVDFRSKVVSALIPYLEDNEKSIILNDTFAAVCEIENESSRFYALVDLIPQLNEGQRLVALQDTFLIANKIINKFDRAVTLTSLATKLMHYFDGEQKKILLQEALFATLEIKDKPATASTLAAFSPYLNSDSKALVLSLAQNIPNHEAHAQALIQLTPYLDEEQKVAAVYSVRKIIDNAICSSTLIALVPYLNEELKHVAIHDALYAAGTIADVPTRERALSIVAPHLNDELQEIAINTLFKNIILSSRVSTIISVAPYLNKGLINSAISAAYEIKDVPLRASILIAIIPRISKELHKAVLQEIVSCANASKDDFHRAHILISLLANINSEQSSTVLQEALSAIRNIKENAPRARALTAVFPYLNEELKSIILQEILTDTRNITENSSRAKIMTDIVPYLDEELKTVVIEEILTAARAINVELLYTSSLVGIFQYLNENNKVIVQSEILSAVRGIDSEFLRVSYLTDIFPYIDEEQKQLVVQEIYTYTYEHQDKSNHANSLLKLAPFLDEEAEITILQNGLFLDVSGYSLNKLMSHWKKIGFKGFERNIIPFIKFTAQKNRKEGLEILNALAPGLIFSLDEKMINELVRSIQDTARWWP